MPTPLLTVAVGLSGDRHRDETDEGQPYPFVSAEKLIADFFDEITRILKERNHD
jgi:hypothetical protein